MDPKELKRIFQRGKCLSLETMRMYNEGTLPSKSAHAVEEHLLECSLCASAIDGLNKTRINDVTKVSSNIHKRLAVYMNTPPQTPVLSRIGLAMIVSSAVIVIGLTTWFLTRETNVPEKEIADSGAVTQYQPPSGDNSLQISEPGSGERSQENGAVSVPTSVEVPEKQPEKPLTVENLPAILPGDHNEKKLTVDPQDKPEVTSPVTQDDNTRTAQVDQYLRIKNIVVYPPTTHTEEKAKSNDGGSGTGQLDRSKKSNADFELDEMPTYPGGNEALKAYIMSNYKAQKEDKDNLKRKSTGVMFQVNVKTGEVSGASLSFMISPATDAELLRVMQSMPNWTPGTKRGTVDVMIGITFE